MSTTFTNGMSPLGPPVHGNGEQPHPVDSPNGRSPLPPRDRSVKKRRGADPFDAILWRLQSRQSPASGPMTIGLLGCEKRAGVTTIATNLAVRASEMQLGPVLLVETDADRSRLRKSWRLGSGPGLTELMAGDASLADCTYAGPAPGLKVIPAAAGQGGDETLAWDTGAVDALLAETCADYRLVLFDLPCADQLHQTVLLARRLEQVLLVIRAESTRSRDAQRIADRLTEDGVPLSGVVLNRSRSYVPNWLKRWI